MALLGSSLTNEVGLRLVLCPLGSNIVIRTARCYVGIVLPVYSTFKAIERKNQDEQRKWLIYWAGWNVGARQLYRNHLRPFLLRHQTGIDRLLTSAYGEMVRLTSTHRAEIEFGRNMILKIFWPDQPQVSNAIEGPAGITTDTETEFDPED